MEHVAGRTVFVTGGAQGIGFGIAQVLAEQGAKVALADIDAAALAAASRELGAITDVATFVLDVRDRPALEAAAHETEEQLGPVSVLFNNAGVAAGVPAAAMSFQSWDWALGINLGGVVNGIQTFVPRMISRRDGYVVNTASGAGLAVAGRGAGFLYHTAKYGVVGLSEALRRDLAPFGIGVSVLCPGPTATNIYDNTTDAFPEHGVRGARLEQTKAWLARGTRPYDVGRMVLDAMRAERLFIHTDRFMVDAIQERTAELLAAMPDPPPAAASA